MAAVQTSMVVVTLLHYLWSLGNGVGRCELMHLVQVRD